MTEKIDVLRDNKGRFVKGHSSTEEYRKKLSIAGTKERNPMWKGGRKKHSGYIMIRVDNHPFADMWGYVLEHRLVMEKHLGRYLTTKEHIHHINGKPDDNRLENLQLLTHSEHMRITNKKDLSDRKCGVCGISNEELVKKHGYHRWCHDFEKTMWLCNNHYAEMYRRNNRNG